MDNLSKYQRSLCMSHIRAKDTKPEKIVRKLVHRLGFRYRLHNRNLPGCPDIVLARYKKVIFVHGCFWHMHHCRYGRVKPKTNRGYWEQKRKGNVERYKKNVRALRSLGWKVFVVWECWTKDIPKLKGRICDFLQN